MGNTASSKSQIEVYLEQRELDAFILKERATGLVQFVPRIKSVESSSIYKRRTAQRPHFEEKPQKQISSVSTASTVSVFHETEQEQSPDDLQMCKLIADFGDFQHLDASLKHARKSEKARLKHSKQSSVAQNAPVTSVNQTVPSKVRKVINLTEEASKCGIYGIF